MNNTKLQLKKLSTITPDREFVLRARQAVLRAHTPMAHPSYQFALPRFNVWSLSGAGLSVALLLVIVIMPFAFPQPSLSASLNAETIIKEFSNLPINIQLKEITYEQKVSQTITSAISEVSDTKIQHLNTSILQTEQEQAMLPEISTSSVDMMLEQVMQ